MANCVWILVGPIAAGKSSHCGWAAKHGKIIINDDAIVELVHGGDYLLYDKSLKPFYKSIENYILQAALLAGRDVIIDRPNVKRSTRARYISIATAMGAEVVAVLFPWGTDEEHARRRMAFDSRGLDYDYWLRACQWHRKFYEAPALEEGFSEIMEALPSGELPI